MLRRTALIAASMRAVALSKFGGPEELSVATDVPRPEPRPHEVLINVKATAVNRGDSMQRKGMYPPPKGASEILGLEASGVVAAVGSEVSKYKAGDKVMALLAGGGYAEYVAAPAGHLIPIPEGFSFEEGAATSEVFLTAWQCLRLNMNVQAGERVLLHAGASGVGTAAAQLVQKVIGGTAITTSSESKVKECLKYAAHAVSRTPDEASKTVFASKVKALFGGKPVINATIDPVVGGTYLQETADCSAVDARYTVLAMMGGSKINQLNLAPLFAKRMVINFSTLRSRDDAYKTALVQSFIEEALPHLSKSVPEDKRVVPVIQSVLPIERVGDAHKMVDANETIGKVILTF